MVGRAAELARRGAGSGEAGRLLLLVGGQSGLIEAEEKVCVRVHCSAFCGSLGSLLTLGSELLEADT